MHLLAGGGINQSKRYGVPPIRSLFANGGQAGYYDEKYLVQAVTMFENMLSFGNHLHIFSEEIARSGEQLGNTPQAFSHLALISAAFNLNKTLSSRQR